MSSPVTLWISFAYLVAAFCVTMTWYFPQLSYLMPHWLEQWMYPIDKTDLDVLRFAHFLALAVIALRFVPAGWPGLESRWLWPMILCGQRSLEIFCLGVALAFAGYFVLTEASAGLGLHFLVGICGILMMSAVAWLLSWYKHYVDKAGPRTKSAGGQARMARRRPMKSDPGAVRGLRREPDPAETVEGGKAHFSCPANRYSRSHATGWRRRFSPDGN